MNTTRNFSAILAFLAAAAFFAALSLTGCPQDGTDSNGNGNGSHTQTAATPTAEPPAGTYTGTVTVTLSCDTQGAAIHYNLNGSTPSLYSSPIEISQTTTLKAIAVKSGMNDSATFTAVYTINDPGLETAATPTADPPAGTYTEPVAVTLSCETQGAAIHYTLDGSNPSASSDLYSGPITINTTTTLKAIAVKSGMNNSGIFSALYTVNIAQEYKITIRYGSSYSFTEISEAFTDLPLTVPAAGQISITIPNYDELKYLGKINFYDEYDSDILSWFRLDYTEPYASYDNLPVEIRNRITADGIAIHLDTVNAAKVDVSLMHIHYLRQAFTGKGIPNGKIVVNAPENKFTPVYDGYMWNYVSWYRVDYWSPGYSSSLYEFYPNVNFMNGIFIAKNPDGVTHRLVYSRPVKIASIGWEPVQRYSEGVERSPIIGIGLEKAAGGSLSLASDDAYVWNSSNSSTIINDFIRYEKALRENGLHPDNGMFLKYNYQMGGYIYNVYMVLPDNASDADHNIAANGMYDFILAYYNPPKDYVANSDPAIEARKDRLPLFRGRSTYRDDGIIIKSEPLTFDGYARDGGGNYVLEGGKYKFAAPAGVTSRNIGGITAASSDRKAVSAGAYGSIGGGYNGKAYKEGEPRVDFIGSVTPAAAKCLREKLGINELSNTNIVGDYLRNVDYFKNVAFIGDYSGEASLIINGQGVIDVKSALLPEVIVNSGSVARYLNIWSDV